MNNRQKERTINSLCTGITLPLNVLQTIDVVRKDVPRSRFILRAIENYLLQSGQQVGAHGQTAAVEGVPTST